MISFKKTFSFNLNDEMRAELEALSEQLGCTTHKELFDTIYAVYLANDGDDRGVRDLQEQIRSLEAELDRERRRSSAQPRSSSPAPAFPKSSDTLFVAEIPDMAIDRVKELKKDMYDRYEYTSNWEILKHFIKNFRSQKAGNLLLVQTTPRLRSLVDRFSQEPIERGAASNVSHYISQELIVHFEGKASAEKKEPPKEEKPPKEEDKGWKLW